MSAVVFHSDCVAGMRALPDNYFDSIVTDPPYELSSDGKASSAGVFLELMFPKNAKVKTDTATGDQLTALVAEILALSGVRFQPGPSAAVEVGAVAFDNDVASGQHNVKNMNVSAGSVSQGYAGDNVKTEYPKHLGSFLLELADTAPLLDALNRTRCGFLSGAVGVGFGGDTAGVPSLLRSSGAVVVTDQNVGAFYDALAILIGTSGAAEDATVARIGLGRGSIDQLAAIPALVLLSCFSLGGAKLVRTLPPTSGLPAELEARRVSVVCAPTNRALTFDLIVHPQSIASMGFMGKAWDGSKIAYSVEMWREALRVLKPGGHLLAFSGSRTYHRMTCAIEDAGFEIRDQIMWVYGSGFPKSLDVSKAIDKTLGVPREQVAPKSVIGHQRNIGNRRPYMDDPNHTTDSDIPATDAAKQWQGWGTALKPAHEPICVARKPLIGNVATNVMAYGTGALNIDGCRIPNDHTWAGDPSTQDYASTVNEAPGSRWPANLIHDGSDEVLALFPDSKGSGPARKLKRGTRAADDGWGMADAEGELRDAGTGSAARFFYCAKASKSDRGEGNTHATVKPHDLMRYLCRLVTPPGGLVLDPFTGSGSTLKAAQVEGFQAIGFEMNAEYVEIARARLLS